MVFHCNDNTNYQSSVQNQTSKNKHNPCRNRHVITPDVIFFLFYEFLLFGIFHKMYAKTIQNNRAPHPAVRVLHRGYPEYPKRISL